MWRWSMFPNHADSLTSTSVEKDDPGSRISATFDSPAGEHYYGLGQQQQGSLNLRDHHVNCWHDYGAIGGENVCVPFMVSNRGYGLIWDNPSKTTIDLGFNQQNVWSSQIGDRVSFFVAKTFDVLGRLLTGTGDVRQLSGPIGIAQVSGQIIDQKPKGPSSPDRIESRLLVRSCRC